MPKFFLTTPIYYVNARPHIGHAYTTLAADTIARRHRLLGDETFFLTGTDEHGQKIERSAAAAGIPPQQFTDEVSSSFEGLWKRMGITHNAFIRTTSDAHKRGAQKLFADLHARGQIYLSSYTGQYSIGEEMFVDGPPGTLGPDGKPTETVTEENFFFRLSDYQLPLLDLIESDTLHIQPEARKNEVLSFLRGDLRTAQEPGAPPSAASSPKVGGSATEPVIARSALGHPYVPGALRDLSVSRSSFTWGIPVPEPAASETKQKHVIYVWLDALANYMTALGYGSDDPTLFDKFWPADLHLVGKEIIRFHCVYWPAFLLAAGLSLPKAVTAHGWLLFDDSKMSKSKGNIVRAETILEAFGALCPPFLLPSPLLSSRSEAEGSASPTSRPPTKPEQDLFATDVLRYFLLREIPFGQDGSFSFDALITRYNADLANGYGNLVSRTLKMIENYFGGYTNFSVDTRPINFEAFPEWWIQDPYATEATFEPELKQDADEIPARHYVLTVRAKGELGLGIDNFCRVYEGNAFYYPSAELSAREVFQVTSHPLLRAANAQDYSVEPNRLIGLVATHIRLTDRFLSGVKPWNMPSIDPRRDVVLSTAWEMIRLITSILHPILPEATAKVWEQLGLGKIEDAAKNGQLRNLKWGNLQPGQRLGPLNPIYPRADKGLAQTMIDMEAIKSVPAISPLADDKVSPAHEPQDTNHPGAGPRTASLDLPNPGTTVAGSNALTTERTHTPHTEAGPSGIFATPVSEIANPQIVIDDFMKVELRVAQILVAERIPKADKLLRLEVDLGYEKRQILSGIAEWYAPEELVGRRIVIVANLAPRKMRGLESHGMLLAASAGENTKPVLTTFGEDIAVGSSVR